MNNLKDFIDIIMNFSPRQLEGETKTADFLIDFLKENEISFRIQEFNLEVPRTKLSSLKADGRKIESEACCFKSGKIKDKSDLISSLTPSICFIDKENINFNPKSEAISLSNFYFAPSLSIRKNDLAKVLKAKDIDGIVEVESVIHRARNIIVGNTKNPRTISFSHYDSIKKGAIDNASGVAVLMSFMFRNREAFEDNLFVFAAAEELSFDFPTYWGHGYRVFEKKFLSQMRGADKIIVIDSVGNGKTQIIKDPRLINSAFPISNLKRWQNKISVIAGDFEKLMGVYHSDLDDGKDIQERFLREARNFLKREIGG